MVFFASARHTSWILETITHMFVGKPCMINDDLFVCFQPLHNLSALPIPEYHLTAASTRRDVLAIRRETNITSIPRDSMASETLLLVLAEAAVGRIDKNLVIKRLTSKIAFCKKGKKKKTSINDILITVPGNTYCWGARLPPAWSACKARRCI